MLAVRNRFVRLIFDAAGSGRPRRLRRRRRARRLGGRLRRLDVAVRLVPLPFSIVVTMLFVLFVFLRLSVRSVSTLAITSGSAFLQKGRARKGSRKKKYVQRERGHASSGYKKASVSSSTSNERWEMSFKKSFHFLCSSNETDFFALG